jgi:hypothetical protein
MSKEYLGWQGVIKLAKELGYSWQEACEVLYRKASKAVLFIIYIKLLYNKVIL